jgi:subtilisin family serine protease
MPANGVHYGAVESHMQDELVAALPDLELVQGALRGLGVDIKKTDPDGRLGLALLTLAGVDDAAQKYPEVKQDLIGTRLRQGRPEGIDLSTLDVILGKLRKGFGDEYGGWVPEMGKNRIMAPVRGFPYVSGCAEGDPRQILANPTCTNGTPQGWQTRPTEPGHGVRVGLLDTQLYPNQWLAGGYLASQDDLLEGPGPGGEPSKALAGHGTFIAGLILHRAPGARLVVRAVMKQDAVAPTWDVAKTMARFVGTDTHILNLSFGCYTDDGQPPLVLAKAVSLLSPQILLVAAAGNHGDIEELRKKDELAAAPWLEHVSDRTPVWPAAFPEVIAVGATDAPFSPQVPWVDVTAPGQNVESTYLDGQVSLSQPSGEQVGLSQPGGNQIEKFSGFACWDGTSFAAASVSGAVAAMIGPGRDARQALQAVLDSGGDIKPFHMP